MVDIKSLIRKNILALKPYATARDEFKGKAEVFLDANENPFPLPYNRYPDPLQLKLKEKISAVKNVAPECIFLGNGSDEAIDLLIRLFCEPGRDAIIVTEPTYGMYGVCAAINDVAIKNVPLNDDFDIDADNILKQCDRTTRMILLASPNNPTGNLLNEAQVIKLLRNFNGIVVVDEAYIDFAPQKSMSTVMNEYPNLAILQTFSKAWGLAGARLGMCFADPQIINILNKIKYPYNINSLTQEAVTAALKNKAQLEKQISEILEQRKWLMTEFEKLACTKKVYRSDANFFLAKMNDGPKIYNYLLEQGIIVRDRSKAPGCENCLRITVGTKKENKKLIDVLKQI